MPKGYRLVIIAAFGWLGFAASPPDQTAGSDQPVSKQSDTAQLARIAAALETLPASPGPDAGCVAGQDDRSSDLCAQWKAADGAFASAIWTEKSFYVGVFGLLIGVFTLLFAGRAAHWAKQAAIETKRGADTADNALIVARDAMVQERRPWVIATRVEIKTLEISKNHLGQESVYVSIEFEVENVGNSPAKDVIIRSALSPHGSHENNDRLFAASCDVIPGLRKRLKNHFLIGGIEEVFVPGPVLNSHLFARIEYNSFVSDKAHTTEHTWSVTGAAPDPMVGVMRRKEIGIEESYRLDAMASQVRTHKMT